MRCGARWRTGRQAGGGGRPRCKQRAGERSTVDGGAGHGEERTENILYMPVTLDVSKSSSWLNADASMNMALMSLTLDVAKCSSWLNTTAPRNMELMSLTLDVSKDSGWLNADALCRESKGGGNVVQGEVHGLAGGRRRATTPRTQRAEERARL